jgi:hypothetical protein
LGFVSLALALLIEALLARPEGFLPELPNTALQLGAIHLLTVGWLMQLISGVAFWMFPRHPTAPPRGNERIGWAGLYLLNGGLLLRLIGESWRLGMGGPAWPLVVAALLQLVAAGLLVWLLWPRIRELRS